VLDTAGFEVGGDRNIVQVFNKDLTMLYATILTIPDYRPQPDDKTIVKFSELRRAAPKQDSLSRSSFLGRVGPIVSLLAIHCLVHYADCRHVSPLPDQTEMPGLTMPHATS
jgi:hypothetical protein